MEFRRFVSYVYEYAGEEKLHNCGFVKVEIRQEMMRLGIHLQTRKKIRDKCQIYGFVRKENRLEGVLIGEAPVQNGMVDVRFLKQVQCVGENTDTPISFEQLGGIVFMMENGGCYSTVWDEDGFSMGNFEKPKEIEEEEPMEKKDEMADTDEREKDEKDESREQENKEGNRNGEQKNDEEDRNREQENKEKNCADKEQENSKKEENAGEQKCSYDEKLHMQEEQNKGGTGLKNEGQTKSGQGKPTPGKGMETGQRAESDTMTDWDQIGRIALPMQPFAWAQDQMYYRLELKDFKYLPKKYQFLMKNSFVIHGYYNYKYLIIGQCERGIVIGIPGVYHPMEDIVAAFFGFGEFWPAQSRTKQNGSFGYWRRFVY